MANLLALFKPKVKVYDLEPLPEFRGDGAVKGRQVALWRPPVMLDTDGRTMSGVSKELIANYLVATTSALAKADLGPVTVEWKAQEGRFATTTLTIHAWGQSVDIMHPVSIVSQDLANAMEHYRAGMALKCRELHKGHQRLDEANAAIRRAMRHVERLRDDDVPHFNDAEFLFIQGNLSKSLVMSALVPVSNQEPEDVFKEFVMIDR
jgi:hypothetical protein